MFILRIIQEERKVATEPFEQVIENFELGGSYTQLKKGHTSEFNFVMENEYPKFNKDDIESIICGQNGAKFFVESSTQLRQRTYFIMSESGQTFERL